MLIKNIVRVCADLNLFCFPVKCLGESNFIFLACLFFVFMARYIMVLRGATSLLGALEGVVLLCVVVCCCV